MHKSFTNSINNYYVTVDTADEAEEDQPTQDGGDPYGSHLDSSVVPIVATTCFTNTSIINKELFH